MFPYDDALLATVQATPKTISDVIETLKTIETACADADGLKWFNWLYLQVTQAVETRLALKSYLSGQPAPDCWQVLFHSRGQDAIARIQFALAGINAHINRDLAEAIVATCQVTGTTPDHGGPHYNDYTALNSTLDALIESAELMLNVRLPGGALPAISHLTDTIAAFNVSAARESAWQNAEHLFQLRALPSLASGFMDMLDGFTTVIGKALLVPVP
jgi:hypothetical protein